MASGSTDTESDAATDPGGSAEEEAGVLLFMGPGRDRELLVETLSTRYSVDTTTDSDALETDFDCCVVDQEHFARNADAIRSKATGSDDVGLPFVLLVEQSDGERNPNVWNYVDDVMELPVSRRELLSRIGNLIEKRRTALELARRKSQLERTIEDLRLKERAIDEAPVGLTITDPGPGDSPITYVNERFEELTGYEGSSVIGRDCRLLQGPETDPEDRRRLREAIRDRRPESVDILNYRQNGQTFWNRVEISPVHDDDGEVTNFVGFQRDITDRKIRERRLEVLNRVLSHNLRNKMNIIEGHAALLRGAFEDDPPESLEKIGDAAADLGSLADTVREIERTLSVTPSGKTVLSLDDRIEESLSAFEDRFPEAEFEFTIQGEGPYEVAATGLMSAIEEAIENAVEHNDSEAPTVEIRLRRRSEDWIDVEVEDDGPGIPRREVDVLRSGETSLNHADRLGLWLIYWVVSKAGGDFSVTEADPSGTLLTLSIPVGE